MTHPWDAAAGRGLRTPAQVGGPGWHLHPTRELRPQLAWSPCSSMRAFWPCQQRRPARGLRPETAWRPPQIVKACSWRRPPLPVRALRLEMARSPRPLAPNVSPRRQVRRMRAAVSETTWKPRASRLATPATQWTRGRTCQAASGRGRCEGRRGKCRAHRTLAAAGVRRPRA